MSAVTTTAALFRPGRPKGSPFTPLSDWLTRHRVRPERFEALEVMDRVVYGIRHPTGREVVFDGIPPESDRLVRLVALPDGMDVLDIPPTFPGIPAGQFVANVCDIQEAEILLAYAGRQLRLLADLILANGKGVG